MITVVGLGVETGDLTEKGRQAILKAERVVVRTAKAASYGNVTALGVEHVCLDGIYEKSRSYTTLYKNLAKAVAEMGDGTVYCVDGAASEDNSVKALRRRMRGKIVVIDGVSKISALVEKAGFCGCSYQAASAYELSEIELSAPLVVYDMTDRQLAGDVKLLLQNAFGDEAPALYICGGKTRKIKLFELDRQPAYAYDSAVAVEYVNLLERKRFTLNELKEIVERLRRPDGCPWDRVQTHASIRMDMLEEAYEAADAIDKKDMKNLCEELGDVLMQVVFHAEIETEQGGFTMGDVIQGICEKMIYRHPHVFGSGKADTAEEGLINWEELKKKEKRQETQTEVMQSVPEALPALIRARKVQKKAADVGFDFPVTADAMRKVYEEVQELEQAVRENGEIEEEFGDILFALVNISRFLKINPEFALTKAIKKFINRFEYIEKSALLEGKALSEMSLEEMDLLWDEAKIKLNPMQ